MIPCPGVVSAAETVGDGVVKGTKVIITTITVSTWVTRGAGGGERGGGGGGRGGQWRHRSLRGAPPKYPI